MQHKIILRAGSHLLLPPAEDRLITPEDGLLPTEETGAFRFVLDEVEYTARHATEEALQAWTDAGYRHVDLREAYKLLPRPEYDAAGKAFQLLFWDETHCRCGRCGAPTERRGELSRVCTECGLEIFPEVWPAIIVLVRRGREALLVHARNFRRPVYGLVAGFVETGESLEECVRREVKEETDLEIRNIRYMGSQPWPYPNSLMLGFTAEYVGGEVRFADEELTSGGFFSPDNLPPLPGPPSIARQLIDNWLEELL
jgi:NAD+ diphosphatase